MNWIDANERKPTHIFSVLLFVVGGSLHHGEDYCEVGIWNEKRQKWQHSACVNGSADDIDVDVSHWAELARPDGNPWP